jgi:PAS domain S-box-containing protein
VVSRKKIEANEKRFEALIENSTDVISLTDKEGALNYITSSFTSTLGYANEEILSHSLFEFIHTEDKTLFISNFRSLNAVRDKSIKTQIRMLHKAGQEVWCEGTVSNMLGAPGINAMVFNFRDISEMKMKDQEREKMVRNLVHHSKNLEQFSYIISHNLRGPVANILGLANVLESRISEEDRERTQGFLFSAVNKMDQTLKDLNKILTVKTELAEPKETVEFNRILNDVKAGIENIIQNSGAEIQSDFSAVSSTITIKGFLHSIFYNLVLNSIKYRKLDRPPVIKIKSERIEEWVKIAFEDNGSGIDLSMHGDKIFGLHKRFHLNIEGRGLGLFMIKTQVESLGGKISVQSHPGEGATFIVELPV